MMRIGAGSVPQMDSEPDGTCQSTSSRQLQLCLKMDETGLTKGALCPSILRGRKGKEMITDAFDPRTIAKMEVALERACLVLSTGNEQHGARRIFASKIIECAKRGNASLVELTAAGYSAALQLSASARPKMKSDSRSAGFKNMASMRGHGVARSSQEFRVKVTRSRMGARVM